MRLARLARGVSFLGALCVLVTLCVTVAVFGFPGSAQAVASLPACEAKSPTIDNVTLEEMTTTGVALDAQINPQGNETTYRFVIVWRALKPGERGEPSPPGSPTQEGHISAGYGDVPVRAFLSGLQPGYTYWYQVIATSLGNSTRSEATALPYFNPDWYYTGREEGPPYVPSDRAGCAAESGNLAASETVREQREKEAATKQAEEAALKQSPEKHSAGDPQASCIVPGLKGKTLSAARHAIARAHCRLGRLRRPPHYHGALIVIGQTPRRGSTLRNGASVTLVLGSAHKHRLHHPANPSHAGP